MNDYNFFKVLKLERKETIHSAMIAAIVGHDEKCWKHFFDMLKEKGKAKGFNIEALRTSIIYDDNKNHKWIDTEVHLTEKINGKTRDRGRADIWIGTNNPKIKDKDKFRLIIENKIDADFQYRQLRKYYRYLTDDESRQFAGLFVLCVKDDEEFVNKAVEAAKEFNNESKIYDDKSQKDTKYAVITYKDIISWLEEVIKETEEGDFKTAVKQYKKIIEGFYPQKETK